MNFANLIRIICEFYFPQPLWNAVSPQLLRTIRITFSVSWVFIELVLATEPFLFLLRTALWVMEWMKDWDSSYFGKGAHCLAQLPRYLFIYFTERETCLSKRQRWITQNSQRDFYFKKSCERRGAKGWSHQQGKELGGVEIFRSLTNCGRTSWYIFMCKYEQLRETHYLFEENQHLEQTDPVEK